jgi:ElaB/YqjD/DUF883 family membrane-anchored ribosome-binding protein
MASRRTTRTAQELWDEVHDLRRRLGAIVASMEAALADGGTDAKQALEEKGRTFVDLAGELVESLSSDARDATGRAVTAAREAGDEGIAELEACIRGRPLTSVAIAFGAGWLAARLTARH